MSTVCFLLVYIIFRTVRKIATKYTLSPIDCTLPKGKFYPSDVLDCLCDKMIANKVALIIFVTAAEDYDESTSSGQYFLHMASQTGIPIIAWNADNSGYTFPKVSYREQGRAAWAKGEAWGM